MWVYGLVQHIGDHTRFPSDKGKNIQFATGGPIFIRSDRIENQTIPIRFPISKAEIQNTMVSW